MKLINPSDDQLDAAFAEHVAGWTRRERAEYRCWVSPKTGEETCVAPFTRSADAVLPWLERTKAYEVRWCYDYPKATQCEVTVFRSLVAIERYQDKVCAGSPSFPRAAVIALLRARGVEVEFNPPTP